MDKVLMDLFLRGLEDGMDKSANIYANVRGAGRALRSAKRLRAVRAARKAAKTATVGPKAIPKRAPVSSHVSHSVTNMPGKGSAAAQQVQANYAHVNPAAGAGFRATPVSNPTSMLAGRQQAAAAGARTGAAQAGMQAGQAVPPGHWAAGMPQWVGEASQHPYFYPAAAGVGLGGAFLAGSAMS